MRPPRSLIARARVGKSGAVISEPFDAIGLAPSTRKYDVRSRSGIASISWWPNSCHATSCAGAWSTAVARPVARAQRLHEGDAVRGRGEGVDVRVAEVDAHGVAAVLVERLGQATRDLPHTHWPLGPSSNPLELNSQAELNLPGNSSADEVTNYSEVRALEIALMRRFNTKHWPLALSGNRLELNSQAELNLPGSSPADKVTNYSEVPPPKVVPGRP